MKQYSQMFALMSGLALAACATESPAVGTATSAAAVTPIQDLVNRVNAARRGESAMSLDVDWYGVLTGMTGQPAQQECFGIDEDLVIESGGRVRDALADGDEVVAEVKRTVAYANRYKEVGDATAGLTDLAQIVDGQLFFGCYQGFMPDPWTGVSRAFFVNTETGWALLTETRWSE
jgi:hypothetical protein